jgi:hypothetical protein
MGARQRHAAAAAADVDVTSARCRISMQQSRHARTRGRIGTSTCADVGVSALVSTRIEAVPGRGLLVSLRDTIVAVVGCQRREAVLRCERRRSAVGRGRVGGCVGGRPQRRDVGRGPQDARGRPRLRDRRRGPRRRLRSNGAGAETWQQLDGPRSRGARDGVCASARGHFNVAAAAGIELRQRV